MSWGDAKWSCPQNSKFMVPESKAENSFIYDNFVKPEGFSFWMDARCYSKNLCGNDWKMLQYANNLDELDIRGCVEMPHDKNGNWAVNGRCNTRAFYICKYSEYSFRKIAHS